MQIEALAFDVFGTVVDWRGSIVREGEALTERSGVKVDWKQFADAWRAEYRPAIDRVRHHEIPWTKLDELHRQILDQLIEKFDVNGLNEQQISTLNRAWHRLAPWADAVSGLKRLRSRYIVTALSNGNTSLLIDMARYSQLPWDCIFSTELCHHYKPDPEAYLMAVELLDLTPHQIMMVASHYEDLKAAQSLGFKTAFVARPLESDLNPADATIPDLSFNIVAKDFGDLADKLGA